MAEKDTIFSSSLKYNGIFNFGSFYKFCYDWLSEEFGMDVAEEKYVEKLKGDSKDIEVSWLATKKVTDYFKFQINVIFIVQGLSQVELNKEGQKVNTNKGTVQLKVKGILIKDYDGKFESTPTKKFMRGIYEKWIIASRVNQMERKLAGDADELLIQAKAYLDLEGKK